LPLHLDGSSVNRLIPRPTASRPMRVTTLVLAASLLALAVPLAAPTASAFYCLSTICPPMCIVCIIILQEAVSLHCAEATNGATTTATCGSWLTPDRTETVDAPVPAILGSYWAREGPSGAVSYGYVLP
jgi:hypothetical protein